MMVARPPAPLTGVTEVERVYLMLVRRSGRPAPAAKRLDVQDPVAADGESDCWTHAWNLARRTGGTYVEGVCRRRGASGPSFHAWVEHDHPVTGRVLVECTPGYEQASDYYGIPVASAPGSFADKATRRWGNVRVSVIQAALAAGATPMDVLIRVRS